MELNDLAPKNGTQRAFCAACEGPLDLVFGHFHETVSDIEIDIDGLLMLECPACDLRILPDRSRLSVMRAHEDATKAEELTSSVPTQNLEEAHRGPTSLKRGLRNLRSVGPVAESWSLGSVIN